MRPAAIPRPQATEILGRLTHDRLLLGHLSIALDPGADNVPGPDEPVAKDILDSFGLDNGTLLQALRFKGGSGTTAAARILLRAAVAALLNSAHPDVDDPRTTAEVIADVNAALASGNRSVMLDLAAELNADNNFGCPLN